MSPVSGDRDGVEKGPRGHVLNGLMVWRGRVAVLAGSLVVTGALVAPVPAAAVPRGSPQGSTSFATVISPCGAARPWHSTCLVQVIRPTVKKPTIAQTGFELKTWPFALYPADINTAYGWGASDVNTGTGKTVGIVDAYDDPTIASNLATFSSEFGLPTCAATNGCFTKVNQTGGTTYPTVTSGWDIEISLDVEYVHAVAPKAHILLVEAKTTLDTNLFDAVSYAAQHAQYVSMSWGGTEFATEAVFNSDFTAHASSVSFFAPSGDHGAQVVYPSASPDVISVGGTTLRVTRTTGAWTGESGWTSGGGGCSQYESATTAQKAFPTYDQPGATCHGLRATPDVSADANPGTGVAIYDTVPFTGGFKGWVQVGGTSLASALWAGHSAAAGVHVDSTYVYGPNIPFYDVTTGFVTSTFGRHTCEVGYDLCTGLGSWNTTHGDINWAAPAAPTGMVATPGDGNVALSWNPVSAARSYAVYQSTSSGGENYLGPAACTAIAPTHGCTVTGLTNGTAYYFTVEASDTSGSSGPSTEVSAIPVGAPLAPTNLHETAKTHTSVSMAWTPPDSTGGSSITHYLLYGTGVLADALGSTTVTDTVGALSAGTTYHFTVQAKNAVGASPPSNTLTVTTTAMTPPKTPPPSPAPMTSGYDLVGSDGGVFIFPTGKPGGFYGSLLGLGINVNDIVGMVPTANDQGYFLVGADGGVFSFGNAPFLGSLPGLGVTPAQPITGIVPTGTDGGYYLVGRDGGVYAFGNAPFLGSVPGEGVHIDDVIGIAATPSGNGYWLVASTGTVYAFGAAKHLGSAIGTSSPVSAIAGTPDGGGYWIVTQNGMVYHFGDAKGFGTLPALRVSPAEPVIGIVHTADTGGYWLVGSDGGIFEFGDAGSVGSLQGLGISVNDIVGAVPTTG